MQREKREGVRSVFGEFWGGGEGTGGYGGAEVRGLGVDCRQVVKGVIEKCWIFLSAFLADRQDGVGTWVIER